MNINDIFGDIDVETNHFNAVYPNLFENQRNQYYTTDKFNDNFSFNNRDLSIFHLNIRSLSKNGDNLDAFLSTKI